MKERTKAYVAGILDAEGYIGIGRSTDSRGINYSARIVVSNKSLKLVKWLVKNFGGFISKTTPKKNTHSICYSWNITNSKHTSRFLEQIAPYLRVKKDQVVPFIQYLERTGVSDPIKREKLYITIRDLKNKVRVTTETPTNSKLDYAYLAGFFDGEGTVSIISFTGNGYRQHAARVFVTNTDRPILELYAQLFGGQVRGHAAINKTCYRWELQKNEARIKAILYLMPYLIVKREEAILTLKFLRLGSKEIPIKRQKIYSELRKLKDERMIQSRLRGNMQKSSAMEIADSKDKRSEHDEAKTASSSLG